LLAALLSYLLQHVFSRFHPPVSVTCCSIDCFLYFVLWQERTTFYQFLFTHKRSSHHVITYHHEFTQKYVLLFLVHPVFIATVD
jgi:hypothetical protein